MAIKDIGGRMRSERSSQEIADLIKRDFANLSDEEKEAVYLCLEELNEAGEKSEQPRIYSALSEAEFAREPVDIETFVKDEYYLGKTCDALYPKLLDDMKELFSGGYREVIMTGSIGYGKTFFASIAACRVLYELSCLRDPHKSLGISKGSDITFICLSAKEDLAIKVAFENIISKIKESPYFKDNFPFRALKKEIQFPNNVQIAARASTDSAALGLNVFAAFMDEGNFMPPMKKKGSVDTSQVSRAQFLYDQLMRRMKSRFQKGGRLPGMMIVVSSKQTRDDFTKKRVKDAKDDPSVFVRDYATWHVKPDSFSEGRFHVLVGNDLIPSRILDPGEVEEMEKKLQEGMVIVQVPEDYREDFENDLEGAIRDIAGVETVSISPFIQQRDKIIPCIDRNRKHPFTTEEWVQGETGRPLWSSIAHQAETRDGAQVVRAWEPRFYPGSPRYVHIDPSLNNDATGFAMGCVSGFRHVERTDENNEKIIEPAPVIWVDFLLRIRPPVGGEIDHGMVRGLVYQAQNHGFHVAHVTMDQFNCLAEGTMVWTGRGILPIEEVVVGDVVQSKSGPRKVKRTWSYGEQETVKITTKDGDVIEGTLNHKIETQSGWTKLCDTEYGRTRNPTWEWNRLEDISVGDVVHIVDEPVDLDPVDSELTVKKSDCTVHKTRDGVISNWDPPETMTPEFAEWLGLVWGDGDLQSKFARLCFHVDDEEDVKAVFSKVFDVVPDVELSPATDKCRYIRLHSGWFARWMKGNSLTKPLIPDPVLRSSKKVKAAFLRGLFSADGSVSKIDGEVTLATSVYDLAQQVRMILRADFNIESCLVTSETKYEGQKKLGGLNYHVSVRGPRDRFLENIGFCYRSKQKLLSEHASVRGRRKFTRVVSIEPSRARVYDLQVDGDPSYVANGFVSHNSAPSLQKFATKGITAERISVDKPMDAYDTLKQAIYENRVYFYDYPPLLEELQTVQKDHDKNKVDHPPNGSKDIADSLAGIVYNLTVNYKGPPMGVVKGLHKHNDPVSQEQEEMVDHSEDMVMPFVQG